MAKLKEKVADLKKVFVKEKKEPVEKEVVIDKMNPGLDPDIPENKQRWLR